MDEIKDAFQKVKEDIGFLRLEIDSLRLEFDEIRDILRQMTSTHEPQIQTESFDTSTHPYQFKPLKPINSPISTGNQGASTDRQTDRQTDRHMFFEENSIENAAEILNSLDNIKKEIRLKFKRLTDQEMLIFSTIYQLEEELGYADYKSLSEKLGLTESSIRDYVGRLIKKGVSLEKKKVKNKNIQLSISPNLRKIASLSTILQLRDI